MSEELKYCSNCGEQQPKVHKVCTKCGYNFETREGIENENDTPVESQKKRFDFKRLGIVVGIIALLLAGGYFTIANPSKEDSIAGTYLPEDFTYEDEMVEIEIDEDYYTKFIRTTFAEGGTSSFVINFFMKLEDEDLYVVDLAEGFVIELWIESDPEMIEYIEEDLYDSMGDEMMNELGIKIENHGDNLTVKSSVLSNAQIWEYDFFNSAGFNLEKVGDDLMLEEELLVKQPVD